MDRKEARMKIKHAAQRALTGYRIPGSLLVVFSAAIIMFCFNFIKIYPPAAPFTLEQLSAMSNSELLQATVSMFVPDIITLAFLMRSGIVFLLLLLLVPAFNQGMRQYFCEVFHGQKPKIWVAFGWYADLGKLFGAIGLYLYIGLLVGLWFILLIGIPTIVSAIAFALESVLLYFLSNLLLIAGIFFFALKLCSYSPAYYIHAANPQMGVLTAVKTSVKITRGKLFEYLIFELSFILWRLFVSLTEGLGELLFTPYYYTACTAFAEYLAISSHVRETTLPENE